MKLRTFLVTTEHISLGHTCLNMHDIINIFVLRENINGITPVCL